MLSVLFPFVSRLGGGKVGCCCVYAYLLGGGEARRPDGLEVEREDGHPREEAADLRSQAPWEENDTHTADVCMCAWMRVRVHVCIRVWAMGDATARFDDERVHLQREQAPQHEVARLPHDDLAQLPAHAREREREVDRERDESNNAAALLLHAR